VYVAIYYHVSLLALIDFVADLVNFILTPLAYTFHSLGFQI